MVSPRWIMLILMIYVVGVFFSGIIEQTYFADTNSQISQLLNPSEDILAKVVILWDISWFDFAMFKNTDGTANELMPLRWFLMIFSVAFWISITVALMSGITTAVKRLTGIG